MQAGRQGGDFAFLESHSFGFLAVIRMRHPVYPGGVETRFT
jgi:hypothetical protein